MNKEKITFQVETERLVLFPFTTEALSVFNADLERFENEFDVVYHGEELDGSLSAFLKDLEKQIRDDPDNYLFFTLFPIVLKENSHVIGSVDFKYTPKDGVTEVGYGLNPDYTGRGYMTEALGAFLLFGKKLGIRTVRADTSPDNIKSRNVLKRCGFRFLRDEGNLWWEKDL